MTDGRGLGDAYSATVDRIKQSGGKSRLAMEALMWVSKSERPMSADSVPNGQGRPGFGKAGPGLSKFSRI